jgi:hypothetical protein
VIQPSPNLQNQAPSLEEASDYDARCLRSNHEVRAADAHKPLCQRGASGVPRDEMEKLDETTNVHGGAGPRGHADVRARRVGSDER